jgi:hypothetical protein
MKLKDVPHGLAADFSPNLFTAEVISVVETHLKERDGKLYVTCQIRGKDVQAKPEEIVRQLWIAALLHQYSYPRQLIAVEYPITVPPTTVRETHTDFGPLSPRRGRGTLAPLDAPAAVGLPTHAWRWHGVRC